MPSIFTSIPSPSIADLQLGPVTLRFYALFILLGIVLGLWLTANRLKARGVKASVAVDIAIWAVPFGIIGGRIYHVLTHWNDYFAEGADPSSALRIWEGGLAIYGAIAFGAVGAWIGCRSAGIRFLSFADALAPGLLLAQAVGRWGNYFNNELFGLPTTLPWGLEIEKINPAYPVGLPAGELFHPTFLYESLWCLLGVVVLLLVDRKYQLQWGRLFSLYLVFYSVGRVFIESIRIDPANIILGLRTNVWSAILGIVVGVALYLHSRRHHPGLEISPYVAGREPAEPDEDSGVDSVAESTTGESTEVESEAR